MFGLDIHLGLFIWIAIATGIVGWNLGKATDRIEAKLEKINSKLDRIEMRTNNEDN